MPVKTIKSNAFYKTVNLVKLLVALGACKSNAQARRLIGQGAVGIDGEKCLSDVVDIKDGTILHCGKRFWRELKLDPTEVTFEVWEDETYKYARILGLSI